MRSIRSELIKVRSHLDPASSQPADLPDKHAGCPKVGDVLFIAIPENDPELAGRLRELVTDFSENLITIKTVVTEVTSQNGATLLTLQRQPVQKSGFKQRDIMPLVQLWIQN